MTIKALMRFTSQVRRLYINQGMNSKIIKTIGARFARERAALEASKELGALLIGHCSSHRLSHV